MGLSLVQPFFRVKNCEEAPRDRQSPPIFHTHPQLLLILWLRAFTSTQQNVFVMTTSVFKIASKYSVPQQVLTN